MKGYVHHIAGRGLYGFIRSTDLGQFDIMFDQKAIVGGGKWPPRTGVKVQFVLQITRKLLESDKHNPQTAYAATEVHLL